MCCNGNVINLDSALIAPANYKNQLCCGFNRYDITKAKCCSGKINDNIAGGESNTNIKCCGLDSYDTYTQSCCNGLLIPYPANGLSCCGFDLYDVNTRTCCNQDYTVDKGARCSKY